MITGCSEAPDIQTSQKAFAIDPINESPVNGFWAGRWKADAEPGEGKSLTCETIQVGEDEWKATFNAVCDKDYSFTMDLPGRKVGDEVVFEVSVDLGEAFGGEYHWTGKVVGDEFNGEYTNAKYNGAFQMTKSDEAAMNTEAYCEVPQEVAGEEVAPSNAEATDAPEGSSPSGE
ncbi:MAG: hypothetical protein KDA93_08555 [Planctomycetaceae bacterium]|nr:hypothetical protein [Planctomycetaceae bacterium]